MRTSNVICWIFWKFQKLYQPFKKPTFNLLCKICQFVLLWKSRFKLGQKKLIWKFCSYVAFWKGLRHYLTNQEHEMHFDIISKNMFWMPNLSLWKTYFWGASLCLFQNFKFQKMCIKVQNGSNINEHISRIVWFDKCAISAKVINFQLIN
jgi:hypothetical protein